jgi:cell wall-associated NlpC family hydrolase
VITVDEFIDKYLGRKMGEGASICFRWVKAILRDEFGFMLDTDYLEMLGSFKEVSKPKFGDVVLMRSHPIVPNHVGIYLRNGKFMHCQVMNQGELIISDVHESLAGIRIVGFLRFP